MKKNDVKLGSACIVLSVMLLLSMGCSAHSILIAKHTYQSMYVSHKTYAPHANKVLISEFTLPTTAKHEIISYLDVGKAWYGTLPQQVYVSMAYMAREIGADAVVSVKTWYQPAAFAWITPHGSGVAIKIIDPSSIDLKEIPGYWY